MAKARIADTIIAGGGIIGLSLGLELRRRGVSVTVLERGQAMREASWAAGGMLVAHASEIPPILQPLAAYSVATYPEFLERVASLSGMCVPFRTDRTLLEISTHTALDERAQSVSYTAAQPWIPGLAPFNREFIWLKESSLDPRDLCRALPLAFRAAGGVLLEDAAVIRMENCQDGVTVSTQHQKFHAANFVNCCGAWAGASFFQAIEPGGLPVTPVKGQMVSIALPAERLRCVLRTPEFYAIPRGDGRVAIGATAERVGFDKSVDATSIQRLVEAATRLLPEIAGAPQLESWAGLRPGTPDGLPILGTAATDHCWHATGHFRDGILLAPGTARVMAQFLTGEQPDIPLGSYSASRFCTSALLDHVDNDSSASSKSVERSGFDPIAP